VVKHGMRGELYEMGTALGKFRQRGMYPRSPLLLDTAAVTVITLWLYAITVGRAFVQVSTPPSLVKLRAGLRHGFRLAPAL